MSESEQEDLNDFVPIEVNVQAHYDRSELSKKFEDIEDYFILLSDKKMKNLNNTLATIKDCLCHYQQLRSFDNHAESIATDLLSIIRKEKPLDTAVSACQLLAVLQVSLDFTSDTRVFSVCRDLLMRIINTSKSPKLQTEAIYSLGLMHYLCECEDEQTQEYLDSLLKLINSHKNNSVTSAALLNWTLVISIQPSRSLLSDQLPSIVSSFMNCLEVNDMDVRIAAGKTLAYINEVLLAHPSYEKQPPLDKIVTSLHDALTEYNRYWSDSKDPEKRASLRQIVNACKDDSHPDLAITLKLTGMNTIDMCFTRWNTVILYELMRRCLGSGLTYHMVLNSLMNQVFAGCIKTVTTSYKEQRKVQKIISEQKRDSIQDARKLHERKMKVYEDMCMDDPF